MAKLKTGRPDGPDNRIDDPLVIRDALQQLFDQETEFPIRVEGTHTLPYFATLQELQWEQGRLVLRLVRPLPHELLVGALFHFLCTAGEQRYEGFIVFLGREGYLQYQFEVPRFLTLSDRRQHKRYPFRPRESAYVILQDSGVPGLGVAGPVVNIGMGGLALRVDRILKLDTGVRVPPTTAIFERGKGFPRIRIQDLPRVHHMEVRGAAAHAYERGPEVILGIHFTGLEPEEEASLAASLDIRDRMQRGQLTQRADSGPILLRSGEIAAPGALSGPAGDDAAPPPPPQEELLQRLRRRCAAVTLVMPPGPAREDLEARLRAQGFHRLALAEALAELRPGDPRLPLPDLCLVDLSVAHAGDVEPLEAVRSIERAVDALGDVPTVILCGEVDPTLLLAQAERTRFIPADFPPEAAETLDGLL